jgi:hypothetical protein
VKPSFSEQQQLTAATTALVMQLGEAKCQLAAAITALCMQFLEAHCQLTAVTQHNSSWL